jgi:hypothetical protein
MGLRPLRNRKFADSLLEDRLVALSPVMAAAIPRGQASARLSTSDLRANGTAQMPLAPGDAPRIRTSPRSLVRTRFTAGGSRIRTLGPGITVDTVFLGLLGILPSAAGIRALGGLSIDFGSTPARQKTSAATAPFRPYPASVAR